MSFEGHSVAVIRQIYSNGPTLAGEHHVVLKQITYTNKCVDAECTAAVITFLLNIIHFKMQAVLEIAVCV